MRTITTDICQARLPLPVNGIGSTDIQIGFLGAAQIALIARPPERNALLAAFTPCQDQAAVGACHIVDPICRGFPAPAFGSHTLVFCVDRLGGHPSLPGFLRIVIRRIQMHVTARDRASTGSDGATIRLRFRVDLLHDQTKRLRQILALFHREEAPSSVDGSVPHIVPFVAGCRSPCIVTSGVVGKASIKIIGKQRRRRRDGTFAAARRVVIFFR
ncbi:hypothetical protein SDC9_103038 [bioreactor metagenome]|uniref:Uncharacterized protein n=1 Tax=bioreactor metagenome TaxID=1076179 RepID=A0A645ATK6_9ZZZZ